MGPPPNSPLFPTPPPSRPPPGGERGRADHRRSRDRPPRADGRHAGLGEAREVGERKDAGRDRKSTRLNSSHGYISYAVFCLKKKRFSIFSMFLTDQVRASL